MSEGVRALLTWVCLATIGAAAYFFARLERVAVRVFASIGGRPREIRRRIAYGNRCLVLMALSFFLSFQDWFMFRTEFRVYLFMQATVFMALAGFLLYRGYSLWWDGLKRWAKP